MKMSSGNAFEWKYFRPSSLRFVEQGACLWWRLDVSWEMRKNIFQWGSRSRSVDLSFYRNNKRQLCLCHGRMVDAFKSRSRLLKASCSIFKEFLLKSFLKNFASDRPRRHPFHIHSCLNGNWKYFLENGKKNILSRRNAFILTKQRCSSGKSHFNAKITLVTDHSCRWSRPWYKNSWDKLVARCVT